MNKVSSKTYLIISGYGEFEVDGKKIELYAQDMILVEKNEWVKIIGNNLKMYEIVNPSFNADDEEYK